MMSNPSSSSLYITSSVYATSFPICLLKTHNLMTSRCCFYSFCFTAIYLKPRFASFFPKVLSSIELCRHRCTPYVGFYVVIFIQSVSLYFLKRTLVHQDVFSTKAGNSNIKSQLYRI